MAARKKKVLVLILSGMHSYDDVARVFHGLLIAKEFKEGGHHVHLIFDSISVQWIKLFESNEREKVQIMKKMKFFNPRLPQVVEKMQMFYDKIKDRIVGVCDACSIFTNVEKFMKDHKLPLKKEHLGHPSYTKYIKEGYIILTF